MGSDRGLLARIDRRLFAELDEGAGSQMVRVPVSDAVWAVWRRYCDLRGLSMGEAIAVLVGAELSCVVDADGRTTKDLVDELVKVFEEGSKRIDERQRDLDARSEAVKKREEALMEWERTLTLAAKGGSAAACVRECGSKRGLSLWFGFEVQAMSRLVGRRSSEVGLGLCRSSTEWELS